MNLILIKVGDRFDLLKVIEKTFGRKNKRVIWLCKCKCGKKKNIKSKNLIKGETRSCGCLLTEHIKSLSDIGIYTKIQNLTMNTPKNNKSGYKGVFLDKEKENWVVQIRLMRRNTKIGKLNELDAAIEARKKAKKLYFKPIINTIKK